MSDGIYLGIDFGTTNSAMAFYDPKEGRAEIVLNDDDQATTPSAVYYAQDGEVLVGQDALNALADDASSTDPQERDEASKRLQRAVKRRLLNPPIIPIPGRKPVRPAEVVSEVLKKLKRDAEEGHFGEEVERAVMTCPAVFGPKEQKVLREAAELAGFGEVELFEEPTAAALAVHERGQRIGKGVLVYDLGAGTFDLAVVVREEDGSFREAMKSVGDARCGGNDFDLALYYHCEEVAWEKLDRPISLTGELDQAFLEACRSRKENLSKSDRSRFSSLLAKAEEAGGTERFVHEVERGTFEGLIRGRIEETVRRTAGLLEQAERRGHEVETVVLIGGSSKVPLVKAMLGEALPVEPRDFAGRTHAVALGAAYRAFELWGPKKQQPKPKAEEEYRKPEEEYRKPEEEYHKAVEEALADGRPIDRWLANELGALKTSLRLDGLTAAAIEREVLGDTVLGIDEEQREARELARKHGVDLSGARGSGEGGWVTPQDVRRYVEQLERSEREREQQERKEREFRASLRHYGEGADLNSQGRYYEALEAINHALSIEPDFSPAWLEKGHALESLGRRQEALEAYERTLGIDPGHDAYAWHIRGLALRNLGRHQEALEAYERVLSIDPDDDAAWYGRGLALENLGRHQEALEAYERALGIRPTTVTWNSKGNALHSLGRSQEALEAYERALRGDPDNATTWNSMGNVLRDLGRHQEALEAYERALRIDPEYANAQSNKDAVLRERKAWEHTREGLALNDQERYQQALEAFDRALSMDHPYHAFAWDGKGAALNSLGRHQEAVDAFDRALSIGPSNLFARRSDRGLALHNLGRHQEALEAYERALEIESNNANTWNNKGVTLNSLGRYQEELEAYEQALRIDPEHADARSNKDAVLRALSEGKWRRVGEWLRW